MRRLLVVTAVLAALAAGDSRVAEARPEVKSEKPRRHALHTVKAAREELTRAKAPSLKAAAAADTAAVPSLSYYGGPVLQSVEVIVVFWGQAANEDAILNHYQHILMAPMFDMLAEYDTTTPPQTIGQGKFGGVVYDNDPPPEMIIDDGVIQHELARLIDKGQLPDNAPGNRLYQIYFAPGISISGSCTAFCAYHTSFPLGSQMLYYSVIPDYTVPDVAGGDCSGQGCGFQPSGLENQMSAATHELIEATTDPGVGTAVDYGPPLAWFDGTYDEIGDICAYVVDDGENNGFIVQNEWSNKYKACVDHVPSNTVSLSVSPAVVTLAPGDTATFDVTVTSTGGSPIAAKLVAPDIFMPGGFTATFSPATITGSGTAKLTVEVDAAVGTGAYQFNVAIDGQPGYIPFVLPEIDVVAAPPAIFSVDPSSGSTTGDANNWVFISGTDINADSVTFGDADATILGYDFFGDLVVIPPGHAPGVVEIVLNEFDGEQVSAGNYTYEVREPPEVVSVDPIAGPVAGGQFITVTLLHAGLDAGLDLGGTTVDPNEIFFFGPSTIDLDGKTHLLVKVPARAAGKVDVNVTTADGQTGKGASFTYGANPAPEAIAMVGGSASTAGGTFAQLVGKFFMPGASIKVGGAAATVKSIGPTVVASPDITPGFAGFIVPPGAAPGLVDVVLTNPDGQSTTLKHALIYLAPAPAVTALTPAYGSTAGGQSVTITGTGFGASPKVTVDGQAVTVSASTATTVTFTTPQHGVGPAVVLVQSADGQLSVPAAFTYLAPPPTVTALSAEAGPKAGGQSLTITGTGFVPPVSVSFGGVAATVSNASATSVSITTPAHGGGDVAVVVTNPDGQASVPQIFTYLEAAPGLTSLSVTTGSTLGQDQVTLTGTGFAAGATVSFGGFQAWVLSISATSVVVLTPPHGEGKVDVVVTNADGQSASMTGAYTFAKPASSPDARVAATPDAGGSGNSGGGGCSVGGGGSSAGGAAWLLGLALLVRRRRRS